MKGFVVCMMGAAVLFAMAPSAGADPLPGRDLLKFSQRPMINLQIPDESGTVAQYYGHDELSTAVWYPDTIEAYNGVFMADDFADEFDRDVVHVRWWGSYMNQQAIGDRKVQKFLISFIDDVPAEVGRDPYPFSHPDCTYNDENPPLVQISDRNPDNLVPPTAGTFSETLVEGSDPLEQVYEYNAELCCTFPQKANTVYWLQIVALVDYDPQFPADQQLEWGWHNRDYTIKNEQASVDPNVVPGEKIVGYLEDDISIWHFQDDAVSGSIEGVSIRSQCDIHMDLDQWGPTLNDEHYVDLKDGPEGISFYSKDLAFELFTVPEPGTLMLLSLGVFMLLFRRSRG